MECPSCKAPLPANATFCGSCGWKVVGDPFERAVHNLAKVGKEVVGTSLRVAERTGRAIEPAVDKTVKAIEQAAWPVVAKAKPAIDKAAKTTRKVVDEGVQATRKAVRASAEAAEKVAKKVKEKVR